MGALHSQKSFNLNIWRGFCTPLQHCFCKDCRVSFFIVVVGRVYRNYWTLDARVGRWTLDAGLWTLNLGRWTLDVGLWPLDSGLWTLDSGSWTLDAGHWTPVNLLLNNNEGRYRRPHSNSFVVWKALIVGVSVLVA